MKKIAVVAVELLSGERGGAERFYDALVSALNKSGVAAELVSVIGDESSFEAIEETYLKFYDLDLSGYDGVISTKAPTYLLRHPNHVCYLLHTIRVFYDMFENEFPHPTRTLMGQRDLIHKMDTAALKPPRTKKVFTIGNEVSRRLLKWNGIESEVLHPALTFDSFRTGAYEYLLMPGRLHRWKRVDLIIKAMRYVHSPVRLKITGTGEDEAEFRRLAKGDARIEFLGSVSDDKLLDLYANALAIPFVPMREDYGYVTVEAFKSGKPVITCEDSGEPAYFVEDGVSGFVCTPAPRRIAEKIDYLFEHPGEAMAMGGRGRESVERIRWDNITNRILSFL